MQHLRIADSTQSNNPSISPARQQFLDDLGVTVSQYKQLASACSTEELFTCLELLRPKHHRSHFRESLAAQIRMWLSVPTSRLKPLSPVQFQKAKPTWPIKTIIPR